MDISDFIVPIFVVIVGTIFTALGKYILTHPRLKKPVHGQKIVNFEILEEDMTVNSTSGMYEAHYKSVGRSPVPYTFVYVTVDNRPYISLNSTARGFSASVICVGRSSKRKVGPYYARPMDTPAPGSSPGYGEYDASKVDVPPGKPLRGFYIAFVAPGEDKFYGFSQNSYKHFTTLQGDSKRYYDWKNPELEMGGETYDITVTFSGENIKDFDYKFPLSRVV